ncbi:MAG: hypothetical protein U1F98_09415 [Verrucomicrobiota bacterium]
MKRALWIFGIGAVLAAASRTHAVERKLYWHDNQWQSYSDGAWTPCLPVAQSPAASCQQPYIIGQPTVFVGQPTVFIGQPTIGIGQPTVGIGQPTIGIGQPTVGIGQPTIGIGRPTVGIGQPMGTRRENEWLNRESTRAAWAESRAARTPHVHPPPAVPPQPIRGTPGMILRSGPLNR